MEQTEAPVIIVGAGSSGLAAAACLNRLDIPNIVLEREDCFASLWQKKAYDRLHLHLSKQICQLPHMPFPASYPKYVPRQLFIDYLSDYVSKFNINPVYNVNVESARFDEPSGRWRVEARGVVADEVRVFSSRYLVVATGESCDSFVLSPSLLSLPVLLCCAAAAMDMDMDMDMEIPLPDELEWLEANSHLQDDYEDLEPPEPYPEEEDQPRHHQIPPKPLLDSHPKSPPSILPEPQINVQKRSRSNAIDAPDPDTVSPPGEKRTRIDDPVGPTNDEDWLRYSPPPPETGSVADGAAEVPVETEKILSRYASEIDGECVPVTGPSGDRVYAKFSRFAMEGAVKRLDAHHQSCGLISEPINLLLKKVEQDGFMKALEASTGGNSNAVVPEISTVTGQLWVDKYAPNTFTELLSDELTNREVLLWLKQWDSCVFGSQIRSTTEDVFSALRHHSSIAQHKKLYDMGLPRKNAGQRYNTENFRQSENLDQENCNPKGVQEMWNKTSRNNGPPEQKILLLCGAPGLGKTTLAHVAAKHCGYRVVEINASDDRSSSTIESKILDVVQMNSVMADSKPKCLVIDEIDGALGDGKGAVDVILKMVSSEKTATDKDVNKEELRNTSSKKRRKSGSLSRPVICICNDLYAPALRPLRQVAKVHKFSQPTMSRVVSRVKYICHKEGLKVSSTALTALADHTECDIRSCLNTLHFLNKKKESLNVMEIDSQIVGRKDMSRSVFDIWTAIFQKRTKKQQTKCDNRSSKSCSTTSFDYLQSLIFNCGNYDVLFDGIHENMLRLHYLDPVMQKTVNCLDGLVFTDVVHRYIMHTQQMSLNAYQPAIALRIHTLIARVEKPVLEWPKSFHSCRAIMMEKMEALRSWHSKIRPDISRHLSVTSFVENLVSPLLHILSPPTLRPVALHLLSEKEKTDLAQLINLMVTYSITYKNTKADSLPGNRIISTAGESSILSFEPPITDFVHFQGYSSGHSVLTSTMKQVLVHEVEKQKILHHSIGRDSHPSGKENKSVPFGKHNIADAYAGSVDNLKQNKSSSGTNLSNWDSNGGPTGSLKLKSSSAPKKPRDFFERFRKLSSKGSQDSEKSIQRMSERNSYSVLFKFNEGFTNAVKRPVRMRDFLL